MQKTIAAALIVNNEEVLLGRCLASLKGIDEIVIVDTGSKDNTVEVAKQFTDKIFTDYKWEDSFCKARNEVKKHVTADWILSIDADEILHDFRAVREAVALAEQANVLAVDCTMVAEDNGQTFLYPRLFKNVPEVSWVGNIHNTLTVVGQEMGNVRITHGYSPAHALDPDRALRILTKEVNSRPDAVREMFYLGRELFYRNKFQESIDMLNKYLDRTRYLPEKAEAYLVLARAYYNLKKPDEARTAICNALLLNAHFKEAILFMADLAGDKSGDPRWQANADQWKRMAETANNNDVLFVRNA